MYGTGNAVTLPLSEYTAMVHLPGDLRDPSDPGFYESHHMSSSGPVVKDYSQKNNFRMSVYHRFDLGIQFHKEKKWGESTWEISVDSLIFRIK